MVKSISAVDSIYGSARNAVKKTAKKVKETIKEHDTDIVLTGLAAAGVGLYGYTFYKYVYSDDDTSAVKVTSEKLADNPSFLKKIGTKIKEKFTIDLNNVPEGIDPTERYFTDVDGKILISPISNLPYPNPWYDPDLAAQKISSIKSATENILTPHVTMESFLNHASSKGSDYVAGAIDAGVPFTGSDAVDTDMASIIPDVDINTPDTDTLHSIFSYIKDVVDNFIDLN